MINIGLRVLFGAIALIVVWLATWPLETGSYGLMIAATALGCVLALSSSRIAVALNDRRRLCAIAFVVPFLGPVLLSASGGYDAIRVLVFWVSVASLAALVAVIADVIMFRQYRSME